MWRSNFRGFVRWGLRKQCKTKTDDSPDKRDSQRFIIPVANVGANRENRNGGRERETYHDDERFFTNRPDCSFAETVGWVGTLIAVGLNVQLHSRRCLWRKNEAGHATQNEIPQDAQHCFSICHLLRSFVFRLAVASPLRGSRRSILPKEHYASSDSLDHTSSGHSSTDAHTEQPSSANAASEQLADVMTEYMACVEDVRGAQLLQSDERGALKSFEKAQLLGSARASYNLGVCYETGKGVDRDIEKAAKYYRQASLAGHPQATYNLGVLQLNGLGQGSTDPAAGLELLQKASVLGVPQAKTFLAFRHLEEGNFDDALPLLKEAAAAKDPDASFYLGLCCERGLAVPKDRVAAAEHYRKAASQNHAQASDALAAIQKATQPRVQAELADSAKPAQKLSTGDRAHAVHLSRYLGVVLPQLIAGNKELRAVDGLVSSDDYSSTCAPCNDTSPTDTSLGVYVL
ncbi:uncharacterized protein LOC144174371 [Haemaphysalis longicornis]